MNSAARFRKYDCKKEIGIRFEIGMWPDVSNVYNRAIIETTSFQWNAEIPAQFLYGVFRNFPNDGMHRKLFAENPNRLFGPQ